MGRRDESRGRSEAIKRASSEWTLHSSGGGVHRKGLLRRRFMSHAYEHRATNDFTSSREKTTEQRWKGNATNMMMSRERVGQQEEAQENTHSVRH